MNVIINKRPVRVGIKWKVSCTVKTKKGRDFNYHLASCYADTKEEVMFSLQCKLKKVTVVKINTATPFIDFAYYADIKDLVFVDDDLLKDIVLPEQIKSSESTKQKTRAAA